MKYDGPPPGTVCFIRPTEADFDIELQQMPQIAKLISFQQLKPFSIIVRNVSTTPISAILVRYDISEVSGRRYYWNYIRENISSFGGTHFSTGTSFLVTPSTQLNLLAWSGGRITDESALNRDIGEMASLFARVQSATVSLDSVVLTDGKFLGPDKSGSFDRFTNWSRAEQDLFRELDFAATWTDAELMAALSSKEERLGDFDSRDHYGRRKNEIAQRLLRTLKSGGRGALNLELQALKGRPRVTLHR